MERENYIYLLIESFIKFERFQMPPFRTILFPPFPFSSIKGNFLSRLVLRVRENLDPFPRSDVCRMENFAIKDRATDVSTHWRCVRLRISLIWAYLDDLRYKRRRRWGATDVWYVAVLLHIEFPGLLLPLCFTVALTSTPFPPRPSSSVLVSACWKTGRYRHSYYQTLNQPQERYSVGTNYTQVLPCHPIKLIWTF